MKDTFFIRLIFLSLLAIGFSVEFTRQSYYWLAGYSISPDIPDVEITSVHIIKLFVMSLLYFSALLILPLFAKRIISKWKLLRSKLVIIIGVLESALLVYSLVFTTGILSFLLVFLLCQPIAIVNGIALSRAFATDQQ